MDKFTHLFQRAFAQWFNWEVYARPHFLYLLLLIPLVIVYAWWKAKKDIPVLKSAFKGTLNPSIWSNLLPYIPATFLSLSIFFAAFALALPQDSKSWEEEKTKGIDIVISMDVSGSMLARDFKPNRLEAAKVIANEFVLSRPNDRFGLVVFAGESFTQCPITIDHKRITELLDQIKMGILKDGTAIGNGLATAVKRLKDSEAMSKVIILLTDGENNAGEIAPETVANLAQKFGIKVYTIGVGKKGKAEMPVGYNFFGELVYQEVPVNIDEDLMRSIAKKTGGKYFRATNNQSLRDIYNEIDTLEKTELQSLKFYKKTDLFLPHLLMVLLVQLIYRILKITYLKTI